MFERLRSKSKPATHAKRLAESARRLRERASELPLGPERDRLVRQARRDETASHLAEWLTSAGLRPPT